ncbi:MAG TPA: hypothetical protein VK711_14215, partial [Puia sp.]|nr:hypothetical protein [Puia sp.]
MNRPAHPLFFNVLFAFLFLLTLPCRAQVPYQFDFNQDCRKAYEEIIKLKLNTGKIILEAEKK